MSAVSAITCYDANGDMMQKIDGSTTSYAYDAENRMTAVSGANQKKDAQRTRPAVKIVLH